MMQAVVENFVNGLEPASASFMRAMRVHGEVTDVPARRLDAVREQTQSGVVLDFEAYEVSVELDLIDIVWSLDSNVVVLLATIDDQIKIQIVLTGEWTRGNSTAFHLREVGLNLVQKVETPLARFISSTLWTLLGLSIPLRIRIPSLGYDLRTQYELSPKEVSKLLQERQLAFRLMAIGSATGISLPFPDTFIDGVEVESIAFCYHAIVDRQFDWPGFQSTIPWEANEESLSWLPETSEPKQVTFRPEIISKTIFGRSVSIGLISGTVDKAVIDNLDHARTELSKLDGRIVEIRFRSVTGLTRMISLRVPHLPPDPWSPDLKKLIDLEDTLDELAVAKYIELAVGTLEGLSDEQKRVVTERPEIDFRGFWHRLYSRILRFLSR